MNRLYLLLHCEPRQTLWPEVLDVIAKIDPDAPIKRQWDEVMQHLDNGPLQPVYVVIDVLGCKGNEGPSHLQDLVKLRILRNHSPLPLYFALSGSVRPASLRYEIRRLGGYFMYASDAPHHFIPQMEEIRLQLNEVQRLQPRWEIVEEYSGSDLVRAYIFFRFTGKLVQVGGSDRHAAVLAVMLKNNGIPRSMKTLQQLLSEDPLFEPSGGPFSIPRLATLKMHIFRDFPRYLQKAFDEARSGYCVGRIIEHVDLGTKAIGFRIRGTSTVTVR